MKELIYNIYVAMSIVYAWLSDNIYAPIKEMVSWPYEEEFPFGWLFALAIILLLLIVYIIVKCIKRFKTRTVKFYANKKLIGKVKAKYKKPINFIDVNIEGKTFLGWFTNKKCTKPYKYEVLKQKKNLKLYAKLELAEPVPTLINKSENAQSVIEGSPIVQQVEPAILEPIAQKVE